MHSRDTARGHGRMIDPIDVSRPVARSLRARRAAQGFRVADDPAEEVSLAPAASVAVTLAATRADVAEGGEAANRLADQVATRQGQALLGALAGLQLAGLGGGGVAARRTLADLARALPRAANPGLDAVLRAIAQRAAVELARSE